jgi:hypothetical protein
MWVGTLFDTYLSVSEALFPATILDLTANIVATHSARWS